MKDKLRKKRIRVDWNQLRLDLSDQRVDSYYYSHFNSKLSKNRQAYWALTTVYSRKDLEAYRHCLKEVL